MATLESITPGCIVSIPAEKDPVTVVAANMRGDAVLDNTHVNRDVGNIVEEIVSQLENVQGCDVTISLEVTAHADDGFDVPVVRAVTENCKALHIDDNSFTM